MHLERGLFLSQSLNVKDVLEKFKQYLPAKGSKFNGTKTPMDKKIRLHKNGATQLRFKQKEIEIEEGAVASHTARWMDRYCGLPMDRDQTYRLL